MRARYPAWGEAQDCIDAALMGRRPRVCEARYEAHKQRNLRERLRLTGRVWAGLRRACRALTFGAIDPAATEYLLVARRAH